MTKMLPQKWAHSLQPSLVTATLAHQPTMRSILRKYKVNGPTPIWCVWFLGTTLFPRLVYVHTAHMRLTHEH